MPNFPSLYVRKEYRGAFRFVISSFAGGKWRENLVSPLAYENWLDAHLEGSEAVANLVMPMGDVGHETDEVKSKLPIYRLVDRPG
jgi:hypothetical protein